MDSKGEMIGKNLHYEMNTGKEKILNKNDLKKFLIKLLMNYDTLNKETMDRRRKQARRLA